MLVFLLSSQSPSTFIVFSAFPISRYLVMSTYLTPHQQENAFARILSLPGNQSCADCSSPHPQWVCCNHSVLVCSHCAGVHRSLGSGVSQVKSVKLDKWMGTEVDQLAQAVSNEFVNGNLLEYSVPPCYEKPHSHSSYELRERYIVAKYRDHVFFPASGKTKVPPRTSSTKHVENEVKSVTASNAGSIEFVGIVKVKVISASLEKIKVSSNPYICAGLGTQSFKTKQASDRYNPIFKEELIFSWNGKDMLCFEVMDSNSIFREASLGYCSVDIASLELPSRVPLFLELQLESLCQGSLAIEILVDRFG